MNTTEVTTKEKTMQLANTCAQCFTEVDLDVAQLYFDRIPGDFYGTYQDALVCEKCLRGNKEYRAKLSREGAAEEAHLARVRGEVA